MFSTAIFCIFLVRCSLAYVEPEDIYADPTSNADYYYAEEGLEDNDIEVERRDRDKFLRFGRKSLECADGSCRTDEDVLKPTTRALREKSDHYIRFGRSKQQDFLRFGRSNITPTPQQRSIYLRFGRRIPEDGHTRNKRSALAAEQNDEILKRSGGSKFMRFGRNSNFMRFGRNHIFNTEQQELLERIKLMQYNLTWLLNEIARHLSESEKKCNGN